MKSQIDPDKLFLSSNDKNNTISKYTTMSLSPCNTNEQDTDERKKTNR